MINSSCLLHDASMGLKFKIVLHADGNQIENAEVKNSRMVRACGSQLFPNSALGLT